VTQFTFLEILSKDPSNTIIGLAQNKSALEEKVKKAGLADVTILQGDVGDLESLKLRHASALFMELG